MLRQIKTVKRSLLTLCSQGLFDESADISAKKLATTKKLLKEEDLRPSKVVEYLDKYVIGQSEAKKTIATSFRNRWRRKALPEKLKK
jgi:ATP-dependent HslUV protease ATP-binding subunit HslU